jgi:hypothetical protein
MAYFVTSTFDASPLNLQQSLDLTAGIQASLIEICCQAAQRQVQWQCALFHAVVFCACFAISKGI